MRQIQRVRNLFVPPTYLFALVLILLASIPILTTPLRSTTAAASATVASTNQPNIILILTDDLESHPVILESMTNFQRLMVDRGVTFTNVMVPISLCCPSRVSVFTGQYAHNHDVVKNTPPDGGFAKARQQNVEATMFAPQLQAAGYRTALIGKYMNGYPLEADPTYVPPGWDEWYASKNGVNYYNYSMIENGQEVLYGETPDDYLTDVITQKAVDFIQRNAASATKPPFFLELSVYAPHGPATPALRHAAWFPNLRAPRAPSFNETDVSDKPGYIQELSLLTNANITAIDTFYQDRVRSMQAVDDLIATVMQTLEETGDLANTYIIFTSDNGYHQGEHRIAKGKQSPYEESVRVPMIVVGPGVASGVERTGVVSTIDLAPTFFAIAGVDNAIAAQMDGRSFLPLLRANGQRADWRTAVIFEKIGKSANPIPEEELTAEDLAAPDDENSEVVIPRPPSPLRGLAAARGMPRFRGLRTERYSYVEYGNGERELYDLQADPHQLENIFESAPSRLTRLFATQLAALQNCQGNSCRTADTFAVPGQPTPTATTTPAISPTPTATLVRITVTPSPTASPTSIPSSTPTHATSTATVTPTGTREHTTTSTPTPTATATLATTETMIATVTATATTEATPVPCLPTTGNILRNGTFEDGTASWRLRTNGRDTLATLSPGIECNQAAAISIQQQGRNVQFFQKRIAMKPNTRYRLSFFAYSNSGHDVKLYLQKSGGRRDNYGVKAMRADLTQNWHYFVTEFTSTGMQKRVTDGKLQFQLGPYDANGDQYFLDYVTLETVENSRNEVSPLPGIETIALIEEPDPPVVGSTISGTIHITDLDGTKIPVQEVTLSLIDIATDGFDFMEEVETDAEGLFYIEGIPNGSHRLTIFPLNGYRGTVEEIHTTEATALERNFVLQPVSDVVYLPLVTR